MSLPHADIESKYDVLDKLREGGMGALYKVRHRLLDDVRVIKVIRPQFAGQQDLEERFRLEAKTAIRLRHPNIAQIYDFSIADDGTAFIVMEYIDGLTLQEMLATVGPPELSLTLEIAQQGLRALSYLHQRGYVHRDIASDNLMITRDFDGSPLVKLIDLGIVKRLTGEAGITATGTFMGKARYSAPEHFSGGGGSAKVDAKSDVYSYGVLLYELLTKDFPVVGRDFSEMIAGHLFRPPRPFEETDPTNRVPAKLRAVVLEALEKDPAKRIASADELADRLRLFQERRKEALGGELDQLFAHPEPTTRGEKPGSSTRVKIQDALAKRSTPRPAPLPAAPVDGDDSMMRQRRANVAMLDDARLLAQLDQLDEARKKVKELLALAPEDTEAQRFLASLEAAGAKTVAAAVPAKAATPRPVVAASVAPPDLAPTVATPPPPARRRPAPATKGSPPPRPAPDPAQERTRHLEEAAGVIAADLAAGRLEQAEKELQLAHSLYGDEPVLDTLDQRLARVRAPLPATEGATPAAAARRGFRFTRPMQLTAAGIATLVLLGLLFRGGDSAPTAPAATSEAETAATEAPAAADSTPSAADTAATMAATPAPPIAAGTGFLVLDAVPWATVRSLKNAAGEMQPLGRDTSTPLRLSLPAGRYEVELAGRDGRRTERLAIEVRADAETEKLVDLGRRDADAYFRGLGW